VRKKKGDKGREKDIKGCEEREREWRLAFKS
jgi:hypothetical protein